MVLVHIGHEDLNGDGKKNGNSKSNKQSHKSHLLFVLLWLHYEAGDVQ